MQASVVAAFAAMSVLLVLTPGADWAYAVTAGLRDNSVVPAVGGIVLGYAGLTAAVAAGIAVIIAGTPGLLAGLTAVGAAYLLWLGGSTLVRPGDIGADTATASAASPWRAVLRGAGVSGLNPKALLLYLALLPQFVDQGGRLAYPGPAGPARRRAHVSLRVRLPRRRCSRPHGPADPPGRGTRRHPGLRRSDDRDRRPAAGRAPCGVAR